MLRPIEIAAGTNAHQRPGRLRRGAFAFAFHLWIVVRRAGFAPAAVIVLTTLQPVAAAQNPVLRHVLADGAQAAQHLPCAINIIDAPTPVPGAVVFLRFDQICEARVSPPDALRSKPM